MPENFVMPAEWERHSCTYMLWPQRPDNWYEGAKPGQRAYRCVAQAISKFERVYVGYCKGSEESIKVLEGLPNIFIVEIENDDSWIRDTGPSFLLDRSTKILAGIDWDFNAWGEIYSSYENDKLVADRVLEIAGVPASLRFKAGLVLEGGSIHVDGEGTVLTTEECLLHPNRNPHMTKDEIEASLLANLGAEKVIWLPKGLTADEDTNGHIDNFCCFTGPGSVLLAWSDNPEDPQYLISREALAVLESSTDAKGRRLEVIKMPIPFPPLVYSEEECLEPIQRVPGERLAASYVNFYLCNGGVICPSFGCETDAVAIEILQHCFPDREVVPVPSRAILLGGGNIHCITQQQPAALGSD